MAKKHIYVKDMLELINRSITSIGENAPADWLHNMQTLMCSYLENEWESNNCQHCILFASKTLITMALVLGWQAGKDRMKLSQDRDPEFLSVDDLGAMCDSLWELAGYLGLPMSCPTFVNGGE